MWALLLVGFLVVAAVDGGHALVHRYYFIGLGPLVAWLLVDFWRAAHPRLVQLACAGLLIGVIDMTSFDARPMLTALRGGPVLLWECAQLRRTLPQVPWGKGEVFWASKDAYPRLGLCFGERVGEEPGPWALLFPSETLPGGCTVAGRTPGAVVARCAQ